MQDSNVKTEHYAPRTPEQNGRNFRPAPTSPKHPSTAENGSIPNMRNKPMGIPNHGSDVRAAPKPHRKQDIINGTPHIPNNRKLPTR